ncbi:murein hydrolase activator EnvC family protein [Micromonospora sp. NPDC003197]
MSALLAFMSLVGSTPALRIPANAVADKRIAPVADLDRGTLADRRAARAEAEATRAWTAPARGSFQWPLDGRPRPVRRFDPPPRPWLPGHRGVDLAGEAGVLVRTAGAGVVLFAGMVAGRPVVSVLHSNGLRTTYEPVQPAVRTGDRLGRGDPIGILLSGHPGCPSVACLHWGLRQGDDYLDPLALLGPARVRLLPMGGRTPPVRLARRAGRAVGERGGRTRRPGCRPARSGAATLGHPTR